MVPPECRVDDDVYSSLVLINLLGKFVESISYISETYVLFGLAVPSPAAGAESLLALLLPTRLPVREVGVAALLSKRSRSSWGVADRCLTPGLPLRTRRSSPRCKLNLVRGPRAVEDMELVMPSKKSLEAGRRVGEPGASERGAGVESWGVWWGEVWWWGKLTEEVGKVDWDSCLEWRMVGFEKLSTVVESFEWRMVGLDKLSCTGIESTFISPSDALFWRTLIIEFFSATEDSSDLNLRSMSLTFLWLCCISACILSFSDRASDNFLSASAPVFSKIAIFASLGMEAASMATCLIADSSRYRCSHCVLSDSRRMIWGEIFMRFCGRNF